MTEETNIVTTSLDTLSANLPTIKPVEETGLDKFGNNALTALIKQFAFDDQLTQLQEAGEESRGFISFELTKAIMLLQEQNEKVNIYDIWTGGKAVEKLNTRVLVAMGVMTRVADEENDAVIYKWSDPENEKQYNYGAVDKEKDPTEYNRRLNNRKRLNIALSNGFKSAIALIDGGTKSENLKLVDDEAVGIKAIIENPPESIAGKDAAGVKPTAIEFGKRTVASGATHSPTTASLVKIATQKHKVEDEGKTGERSDVGNERSGEAKLAMTDEVFGGMVNNLKRAIIAQEGIFTVDMNKQMSSLITTLTEAVAQGVKTAAPKTDDAPAEATTTKKSKK